jgi:hypothetical protein
MKPGISLRKALADKQLLGTALPGQSWFAWRTLLLAAMGEVLSDEERQVFSKLTGREREPGRRVEEFVAVVGRRGGKSKAVATLAAYLAGVCEHPLVRGERGVVLCIAPDQRQAAITLDYAEAALMGSPILRQLVANRSADTLTLTNRISIEVRAASFRRLRGPTYVAVLADEAAFWYSDELSANADVEIINAVRPGLLTTGGPLIVASSPYARRGVLWTAFKKQYGPDGDPLLLVARGASRDLNPSLPQRVIDREYEKDPASAAAEYGANFRSDIESFVPIEVVEACLGDHVELAPLPQHRYRAFCDPSGGSSDSFTLAISHKEGERTVIDCLREVRPPFSPEATINDFTILLKSYRINKVTGDKYAGEFPRELFRRRGISYVVANKPKSDLYRDLLPALNSGHVLLPRCDRLANQLTGLERRTTRAGRDSIDHAPGGHDDLANAVAGAFDVIAAHAQVPHLVLCSWDGSSAWWPNDKIDPREWAIAEANVRNGSAPSTIAAGSDIPSDETMRRMQAYAERQRQQQKQQKQQKPI